MRDLVLLALPSEAPNLIRNYDNVFVIGVGKVASAVNTSRLISLHDPIRVINLGTAGGITVSSGIYRCSKFFQHDMNHTPIGLQPCENLEDELSFIDLGGDGKICASGDLFVTEPHKLRAPCDIVEMEAYSVVRAAIAADIEVEVYKYISDNADAAAGQAWQEQVSAGEQHYLEILEQLNATLEPK